MIDTSKIIKTMNWPNDNILDDYTDIALDIIEILEKSGLTIWRAQQILDECKNILMEAKV